MPHASNPQGAPHPARRYRGSVRRVRQISWRRNTPGDLVMFLVLTLIAVVTLLLWIGEHAE
jgi:hypothetical protein